MELVRAGGFNEKFFENLHSEYGQVTRFFLTPTMLNLSVVNPLHINELYRKTRSRPFETELFLWYLGKDNLLFTHGPMVKQMRLRYGKMVTNLDQLAKLNQVTYDHFGKMTESWGEEPEVNLHGFLGPAIYDVMGRVLFGGSWTEHGAGKTIYDLHVHLIQNVDKFMFYPFPPYFLPSYIEYLGKVKKLRAICGNIIDERAAQIAANPKQWENDESALTLLNTSVDESGKPFFSRDRKIATMIGFLNGAYDTTHSTTYWMFWNLAKNPSKQMKLKSEIRKVIGTKASATVEQAREIEYLDAFIKESMRFCATVPVNQRINYEEDITVGTWTVPKGTCVNIPMSIMFNDKRHFGNNVEEFSPERFMTATEGSEAAKRAWLAFGGHSRMCVGFTFALVELKAILICLLQQYDVELCQPDDIGAKMIEAGVNQPLVKSGFRFKNYDPLAERVEENVIWWTPEKAKRKTLK